MGEHDLLFRRAFSVPTHAAAEIRSVLPAAVVERIDLGALRLLSESFVDDAMGERRADLVYETTLDGRPAYVCFLLEHQSAPDPLMPFRMLEYVVRLWAHVLREEPSRRTLPAVVPIVIHHGEGGWTGARGLHALVDSLDAVPGLARWTPGFDLVIDDLARVDDDDLLARPLPPFARVVLFALRDSRRGPVLLRHLDAWVRDLATLDEADLRTALRYLWAVVGQLRFETFRRRVVAATPTMEAPMGTIAEELEQRGLKRGIRQGREEGRQEGRLLALRDLVERLAAKRFGTLDEAMRLRITGADLASLEEAAQRVLDATRPEDLFDDERPGPT